MSPVAGIWFTVFNPCPDGDTDCAQCQWTPTPRQEAAGPPVIPLVPHTKCLAKDGMAGYCLPEANAYFCKSDAADCAGNGGDVNKV